MKKLLQSTIKTVRRSPLGKHLDRVDDYIRLRRQQQHVRRWDAQNAPLPVPDIIKQQRVVKLAQRYGLTTLVETGTLLGDMIAATRKSFKTLYTIELSPELASRAKRRFRRASNVVVLEGDSGQLLKTLIPKLSDNTLFWLDAHYSAGFTARGSEDSPVLTELETILTSQLKNFVIVADDATDFGGEGGYPTIDQIRDLVTRHAPHYTVAVHHNAISIFPKT